jgi:hypothetical protein
MPGGGHSDAAAVNDALGMRAAAKGAAAFLLSSDTSPLAMAVYGPWGRGKVRLACKQVKNALNINVSPMMFAASLAAGVSKQQSVN